MVALKAKIKQLEEHTGLLADDDLDSNEELVEEDADTTETVEKDVEAGVDAEESA